MRASNYRKVHDTSARTTEYYLFYVNSYIGFAPQQLNVYCYTPAVYSNEKPSYSGGNATKSVFVVFDLKPEVTVAKGDGSEGDPYELKSPLSNE